MDNTNQSTACRTRAAAVVPSGPMALLTTPNVLAILLGALILAGMAVLGQHNYLLFHGIVEISAVVIAGLVFAIVVYRAFVVVGLRRPHDLLLRDLKQSEEKYRSLFHGSHDAMGTFEPPEWKFTSVNPAGVRMFRASSEEELLALGPQDISPERQPDGRDSASKSLEMFNTVLREGTHDFEWTLKRFDGEEFPASVRFTKSELDGGVIILGSARDMTLEREAERRQASCNALESANKTLKDLNRRVQAASLAKGEFLANMSHEIRTPMTAILGFAGVLMDSLDDHEQLEAARTIKRNGEYLLRILNDILDLSKIEAGHLQVARIPCSLSNILSELTALMEVRADSKGLSLRVEYCKDIPDTIWTDPTRLRQILINLIGNAVKFTERGTVRIRVRVAENAGSRQLKIEVIDRGIGMTPDQVVRLFQPFTQADSSTTRRYGGTGLGLSISRRLARLLGGDIEVRSVAGRGSTFALSLPSESFGGQTSTACPDREEPKDDEAQPAATECQLPYRVLLVEDCRDNQRLLRLLLTKAGAEVEVAENGQEAVQRLLPGGTGEGDEFDVVLMDMQMPVLSGYEATRQLRRQGYCGPVIALTACAMSEDRHKCIEAGCDDYITKPVDSKWFAALVRQSIQRAREREAMAIAP